MFPSEKTVGVANRKEEEEGVNQNIMLLVNFCVEDRGRENCEER